MRSQSEQTGQRGCRDPGSNAQTRGEVKGSGRGPARVGVAGRVGKEISPGTAAVGSAQLLYGAVKDAACAGAWRARHIGGAGVSGGARQWPQGGARVHSAGG
jgi:hypothetical protein